VGEHIVPRVRVRHCTTVCHHTSETGPVCRGRRRRRKKICNLMDLWTRGDLCVQDENILKVVYDEIREISQFRRHIHGIGSVYRGEREEGWICNFTNWSESFVKA